MTTTSKIEWTEQTWNPITGCTKISSGCKNCYAETMAKRLKAMGTPGYENGFDLTLMPSRLTQPLNRKKPTVYFVNSMSDLFHEDVQFDYIDKVMDVIELANQHVFQILSKRADTMAEYFSRRKPPHNTWIGTTVENIKHGVPRINELRKIDASIRFLSIEPLLEDLGEINLMNIDWVIVGGESGSKARPMNKEWAENIKRQCSDQNVAFFFKQWGRWGADGIKRSKKENGRLLNGREWNQMPIMLTAT